MLSMTLLSFLFFTGLVIVLTWWFTRSSDMNTDEGYFLAGRSLTGIFHRRVTAVDQFIDGATDWLERWIIQRRAISDVLGSDCGDVSCCVWHLVFLPRYLKVRNRNDSTIPWKSVMVHRSER